jgi:ribonuclease Z
MSTVVISHGHMDHVGALGYWASQRYLNSMGSAHVVTPRAISDGVERLLDQFAELEGGRPYDVGVVDVDSGDRIPLRPDMDLLFFETDHWVPTLGCLLVWKKHRLRAELAGLPGEEIARRRRSGQLVTEESTVDLVAYCADSGPALFSRHPEVLVAEVVLLECSFFRPNDRDRAATYGHMHLDDLLAAIPRFQCRHLILLHASRRHRLREVETILEEQLRPQLDCTLHHLMVDWD